MAGPRRLNLPLLPELSSDDDAARPRLESARAQLGGPGDTDGLAGERVALVSAAGERRVGVVLYANEREVDVWFEGSVVRRTLRGMVSALEPGEGSPALDAVVADVKVFASLRDGDRVRWQRGEGGVGEGKLIERCRYGALVASDDGRILAVGFRRLWPAVTATD